MIAALWGRKWAGAHPDAAATAATARTIAGRVRYGAACGPYLDEFCAEHSQHHFGARYLPVGRREARHSERQPAVPFLRHSRAVQGCRLTFRGPPIRAASSLTIGKGGKVHTSTHHHSHQGITRGSRYPEDGSDSRRS